MERTGKKRGRALGAELNNEKDGLHYAGEMQGCGSMCSKWRGCLKVPDHALEIRRLGTLSRFERAQASEEGGKSCDG